MKAIIKYFLVILLLSAFAGLVGECQTKIMSFNIRYDNPNDKEKSSYKIQFTQLTHDVILLTYQYYLV